MSVVLDANALVVLALDRRRAVAVETLLRTWKAEQQDLHAPALLRYEIASARPSPPASSPSRRSPERGSASLPSP